MNTAIFACGIVLLFLMSVMNICWMPKVRRQPSNKTITDIILLNVVEAQRVAIPKTHKSADNTFVNFLKGPQRPDFTSFRAYNTYIKLTKCKPVIILRVPYLQRLLGYGHSISQMQQQVEERRWRIRNTRIIMLYSKLTSTGDYRKTIKDKWIP